jgi:hypothetical protein
MMSRGKIDATGAVGNAGSVTTNKMISARMM